MKNFAQVIVVLVLITIGLILGGIYINNSRPETINPVAQAATSPPR